jgi:hypothetical protein
MRVITMKTLTAIKAEQGGMATKRAPLPRLGLVEGRKTRPIDVISLTAAILVLDKGSARPLGMGEQPSDKTHLVRTNGLTGIQKTELGEQNVRIHYPNGDGVPYVEVSPLTARWLMDMASGAIGCH